MRFHEQRVMLLGGLDGLVPKEMLNRSEVRSVGQKLDGERIPEAMRVGVNSRDYSQTADGAAQILSAGDGVPLAGPEKIDRADCRQSFERVFDDSANLHLDVCVRLSCAKGDVSRGGIQGRPTQDRDIRNPQTSIEQHIDQSAGAVSDIGEFAGVISGDLIAGRKQFGDLFCGERQRGDRLHERHLEALRQVVGDPLAIQAPSKKSPQVLQFLAPGAWLDLPALGEGIHLSQVDGAYSTVVEESNEVFQRTPITSNRGFLYVPLPTAVKECLGSNSNSGAGIRKHFGFATGDAIDALLGAAPICGLQALPDRDSIGEFAVRPDWARAERICLPLIPVAAGLEMPSVGMEHRGILSVLVHILVHGAKMAIKANKTRRKPVGVVQEAHPSCCNLSQFKTTKQAKSGRSDCFCTHVQTALPSSALPERHKSVTSGGGTVSAIKRPIEPVYLLFGARVQQVRDTLGLSQEELAKKVSLTRASIANVEAGKQRVLLHDADRFARAFGISTRNLMKGIWL